MNTARISSSIRRGGPQIDRPEGSHFFSLNMAELRIQNLRKGQRDHLLEALMGVKEYDLRPAAAQPPISVLDCTCGFGADAAVASFGLPAGSRVDALEVSPLLEAVTAWGFSHFVHKKDDVTAALRRISLRCGDYRDYLLSDEGPVYDVLYFDPMFQRPVEASCQFQPVRAIMEHGGLTRDLIERALQKARRRVVIKERDFRQLCRDFPDVALYGGKYSRIGYAVLECDSWKKCNCHHRSDGGRQDGPQFCPGRTLRDRPHFRRRLPDLPPYGYRYGQADSGRTGPLSPLSHRYC